MRTLLRRGRGRAGVVLAGAGALAAIGVGVLAATAATDAPPVIGARMPTRAGALDVAYIRASHLVPGLGSMVVGILPETVGW